MQRQILLPLALVIAAVALWLGWRSLGSEPAPAPTPTAQAPTRPGPDASASAAPIESAEASQPDDQGVPTTGERVEVSTDATWVIEGRATRGPHDPYPDVGVRLRVFAGFEAEGEPLFETRLKTDGAGNFQWRIPPPTASVTVRATGDEEGHTSYGDTERVIFGEELPKLEVRLYPEDCTVAGIVRDTDGAPIEGAEVRTNGDPVRTDAEGRYSLPTTSLRETVYVYAVATGYAQARVIAKPNGPGSVAEADFELTPSFQVMGRVVDEAGTPVMGAVVRSFFTNRNDAETDAQGRYLLDFLDPARERHTVYARKPGYVEASTVVTTSGAKLEIEDLVLTRGVRVAGRVVDISGQPVVGAELYIGFSPSAYNRIDAMSEADGSFEFPNVPTGHQTLVADRKGYAPHSEILDLAPNRLNHDGMLIRLERGHFIGGIARDTEGEPVVGVSISTRFNREYFGSRYKTDADGRFRIEGLPKGNVDLEFYGRGFVRTNAPITTPDREDMEVTIPRSGSVAGRVVDAATGEPLREFTIRFVRTQALRGEAQLGGYSATWAREGHTFSGTDGYWDSGRENLTPGAAIGIEARAEGYAPGRIERMLVATQPDADAHVLPMFAGTRVSGRVLDTEGLPVAGARVGVRPGSETRPRFSSEPHDAGNSTTTSDGSFSFDAVAPGDAIIIVEVKGKPMLTDGPFTVPESGSVERLVQFRKGSSLEGRVLSATGAPDAGATLVLHASEVPGVNSFRVQQVTAADGSFTFEDLPPGVYQLSRQIGDAEMTVYGLTQFVRVGTGPRTTVELRPAGTGRVVGTIRRKDGGAVPERLSVWCHTQFDSSVETERLPQQRGALARGGHFEIDGLAPGTFAFSVHHWNAGDHLMGTARVELSGGTVEVLIELDTPSSGR